MMVEGETRMEALVFCLAYFILVSTVWPSAHSFQSDSQSDSQQKKKKKAFLGSQKMI